jgi:hypothetical protein
MNHGAEDDRKGLPEEPSADPAATVDALERKVERERGAAPTDAEPTEGEAEDVARFDPDADPADVVAGPRGKVEPPD